MSSGSKDSTYQLGFHFDQRYCTGCQTCQIACKDAHNLPEGVQWRQVNEFADGGCIENDGVITQNVRAWWLSLSCLHCKKPVCMTVCKPGAIRKRSEDGIVVLDQDKCIGCRRCVKACPYGAIQFNRLSRKASKCDFCLEDQLKGRTPACVSSCPLRVLTFGSLEDLQNQFGPGDLVEGMPDPALTEPSFVVTGHRDAVSRISNKEEIL